MSLQTSDTSKVDVCANVAYHVADFLIKRWRAWWCLTSQKGLQTADHSLTPYGDFPAVFVATEARFFFFSQKGGPPQAVFMATKPGVFRETWGHFQPFKWPQIRKQVGRFKPNYDVFLST